MHNSFHIPSCTPPVGVIMMPPRAHIISIPLSKLQPRGFLQATKMLTLAHLPPSEMIETGPMPQHAWAYHQIVLISTLQLLHSLAAAAYTNYWSGASSVDEHWTLHAIQSYNLGSCYIHWPRGGKGGDDTLSPDPFPEQFHDIWPGSLQI